MVPHLYTMRMIAGKDRAVGAIVVCRAEGRLLFCLIQNEEGHWGFPKGHLDDGESDIDTVRRELAEETGITEARLDTSHTYTEEYQFERKGKQYNKTVDYFLAFVEKIDNKTPEEFRSEIPDMRWLSYQRALEIIRAQSKPLLMQVYAYLESRT